MTTNNSVPMTLIPPVPPFEPVPSKPPSGSPSPCNRNRVNQSQQTQFPSPTHLASASSPTTDSFGCPQERGQQPWHMASHVEAQDRSSAPTSVPEDATTQEADLRPWKWRGYPEFSKWMASDDDFFISRRFGTLNARVILMLQDRLTYLEEELVKEDESCAHEEQGDNGTLRHDARKRRQEILTAISWALERYSRCRSSR